MPYIITTKRTIEERDHNADGTLTLYGRHSIRHDVSRRAVATLDDPVEGVWQWVAEYCDEYDQPTFSYDEIQAAITESGGTIGPLPDGTVIEVERVHRAHLLAGIRQAIPNPRDGWPERDATEAELIDAYNAAQGATA